MLVVVRSILEYLQYIPVDTHSTPMGALDEMV